MTSKLDFNFLNSGNFPSLCWAHSTFLWDNSFRIVDREERKVSVTFSKTFMALGVGGPHLSIPAPRSPSEENFEFKPAWTT